MDYEAENGRYDGMTCLSTLSSQHSLWSISRLTFVHKMNRATSVIAVPLLVLPSETMITPNARTAIEVVVIGVLPPMDASIRGNPSPKDWLVYSC